MNINMSESQFNKLIQLCKKTKKELSGVMNIRVNGNELNVVGIELDSHDLIESSSSKEIIFKNKEYITDVIYKIALNNEPVYVRFHTHPTHLGAPSLSKADIEDLKYVQSLALEIAKAKSGDSKTIIEGIITNTEIAFYMLNNNKVVRVPFFVNGVEKIPFHEKNIFQAFKHGLNEGKRNK